MSSECSDSYSDPRLLLYRDLFCRICLQYSKGALIPVDAEIKKTTLLDMFIQLTTFELDHNDAFPRFMCEQCVSKLTLAYSIREEFISQTDLLLKLVVQKQIIKYYEQFPLDAKVRVSAKETQPNENVPYRDVKPTKIAKPRGRIPNTVVKPEDMVIDESLKHELVEEVNEVEEVVREEVLNDATLPQDESSLIDFSNDWESSSTTTSLDEDDWSYSLNPITPQKLEELKAVRPVRRKYPNSSRKRAKPSDEKPEKKERKNQYSTTTCYICDTHHESIAQRDDHFRNHIHMLPYECTECVADPQPEDSPKKEPTSPEQTSKHIVLRSVIQLNSHMMMHGFPHKCEHCYRRFTTVYLLNHHLWNYHQHSKEADMLERLLGSFKLKQTPNLPNGVCSHCVAKLEYAYHVQKELVRNEQRLRHYQQDGNLLRKLFEHQTTLTVTKEDDCVGRMMAENGGGLLTETIQIEPKMDAPDMSEAESQAAAMFKTLIPPDGWAVMACDCPAKPSVATRRAARPSVRPPKRPLRSHHVLRQAIDAENPTGLDTTTVDPCKCYICNIVLESEEGCRNHLAVHVNMLPHICPECNTPNTTKDGSNSTPITSLAMLQRHYRMHSYPLKCPHCSQRFRKHTSVYTHVRYRHEMFDNPEGFTCDVCGITMQYRPSFMYHMRIHYHEQMGTFRCQYCDRVFGTRARLDRHERVHTGERPFGCHLCPKTFAHAGQLAAHMARHNNERGHQCTQCGKAFFSKAILRQHLESHETIETRKTISTAKVRQRPCSFTGCTHVARTYQAYYMHRLRHEMAHRCEECGRRFARACELRRHRRIYHSSEHPFQCEPCSKTFLSSQSYREHMDSHANVRRFECDICDKKFVRRRNLVNHRMSHTNERPYRCEYCDSTTFKYKSDLNRHRKDKHGQMEQTENALAQRHDEADGQNIVLMNADDPIMDVMLEENAPQGILINGSIELDGTYGEEIETVEESIVVEQPIVTIGIDEVTKQEYIIEYINHA
uniref:Protein krueppel n=1 Tax=Anopheles christyi TaxID=43041 RepID=A0A182JWV0_9DIPT